MTRLFSEHNLGYLLCIPALVIIFSVAFFPILNTCWISLHSLDLRTVNKPPQFIGVDNYLNLIKDQRMWTALWQTIIITVLSVAGEFFLGLALALVIHQSFRGRGIVRAISLVPWAIPTVVSALLWLWIFNDQCGIFNEILVRLQIIPEYKSWLGVPSTARFSVILAEIWKTTPFMALLLLAGLQMIPQELYEVARTDGASRWRQFWNITLPLLRPAILIALLFRTLDAFRIFDLVFVLTGGGPGNSTETLSLYTYKQLFSYLDFGYGSTLAIFTFLCVAVIAFFYIKILKLRVT